MNKKELAICLSGKVGIPLEEVGQMLDALLAVIVENMKKGEKIHLVGFGCFETIRRPARQMRNPGTGQTIDIAAAIQPRFRAAKGLKDALNATDVQNEEHH